MFLMSTCDIDISRCNFKKPLQLISYKDNKIPFVVKF